MKDFTKAQKIALATYLMVSTEHSKLQNQMSNDEYRPMTAVFAALNELNKHFTLSEIDSIIIHRDELAKMAFK